MATKFNQTRKEWVAEANLAFAAQGAAHILGLGIFVLPNPREGVGRYESVAIDGLSYLDAAARAEGCVAFKWIPETKGSIVEFGTVKSNGSCNGLCLDDSDCGNPGNYCICVNNECWL